MAHDVFSLTGKDTADYENARVRAKTASLNALFDAGDAEPLSSGANGGGSAELERVSVGIGFDNREQIDLGASERRRESESCLRESGY